MPVQRTSRDGSQIKVYYCGNKHGVWQAYSFAERRATLKNVVCFVDKDLDEFCAAELPARDRLFVTQFYSIENYLCTPSGVDTFLGIVVGLANDSPVKAALLAKFGESLAQFQRVMLPVLAWAVASRIRGAKIVFANVGPSLDCCIALEDFQPREKYDLVEFFQGKCIDDHELSATKAEVSHWIEILTRMEPKTWLRGKYELWFVIKFMNETWEGLAGQLLTDRRKIEKAFHLSADNVFAVLGDKLAPPLGLSEFLQKNIAA
jgi:hypothetical protein